MQDKAITIVAIVAAIMALLAEFHPDQVWPFVLALIAAAVAQLLRRSDES